MFTQCSKCETIFELSADVLRTAGGQVRCGHCGEIFNALARLAEDAAAFQTGESSFELESRADAILEGSTPSVDARHRDDAPEEGQTDDEYLASGTDIAHLRVLGENESLTEEELEALESLDSDDATPDDPAIFEFTLPPGELDRIFVESKGVPSISLPPGLRPPRTGSTAKQIAVKPLVPVTPWPGGDSAPRSMQTSAAPPLLTAATHTSAAKSRQAAGSGTPIGGLSVPDSIRLEMLAGAASRKAAAPTRVAEVEPRPTIGWWIGAIALSILLALQMVHENRQALAGAVLVGPTLRSLYSKLGSDVALPVDLNGYQLRQWGVSAVPDASNALRVRASIMNVSSQLRPYPLLRVSLANRFGTKIGSRNFEPAEYTGKPIVRMLAPGERVDATVDILDPGNEAEGFEINICLRATDKRVSCVGENPSANRP